MPITVYPWQERQWQELIARRSAFPHALLFRGREGIGKLDFVRRLAQALACEAPATDGTACRACLSCRWFAAGTHPDYREILPAALRPSADEANSPDLTEGDTPTTKRKPSQEIRVDDVRELQDFIMLTAHRQGGKTIVFYPAELLNPQAANALLKNLEEPPPGTRFMLIAHRPGRLPATIISRCQQVALPTPTPEAATQWLREAGVADPALSLAHTGNAPLAARLLTDDEFWVQRKVLLEGLAAPNINPLALAERVRDFPVARLLGWLQRWTYDLLTARAAGRTRYNPDFAEPLARLAARLRPVEIARYHRWLVQQQGIIYHPLNARLQIEQLLLSYAALARGKALLDVYA